MATIPVFLPGEFCGQRSLAGHSPWGHKESDATEQRTLSLGLVCPSSILPYSLLTEWVYLTDSWTKKRTVHNLRGCVTGRMPAGILGVSVMSSVTECLLCCLCFHKEVQRTRGIQATGVNKARAPHWLTGNCSWHLNTLHHQVRVAGCKVHTAEQSKPQGSALPAPPRGSGGPVLCLRCSCGSVCPRLCAQAWGSRDHPSWPHSSRA